MSWKYIVVDERSLGVGFRRLEIRQVVEELKSYTYFEYVFCSKLTSQGHDKASL